MRKQKYVFDPITLEYKLVVTDRRRKLKKFSAYFLGSIFLSIIYISTFLHFFDSPEERKLKRENKDIITKFQLLDKKIEYVDNCLNVIQMHDDNIYRTVFEIEPISSEIRNAGFGGVNRYEKFENWLHNEQIIKTTSTLDKISKKLYVQTKSFDDISFLAKNKDKFISSRPAILPIAPKDFHRISDYFGSRKDPFTGRRKVHHGIDFAGPSGKNIYATGDGVVEDVSYNRFGYGRVVTINHGFGYKSRYAHLERWMVEEGQLVKRGDVIGLMGNTGRSTGPHLHYEVIYNGKKINPINYFRQDVSDEEFDLIVSREELIVNN